jgi:hypothetical protein
VSITNRNRDQETPYSGIDSYHTWQQVGTPNGSPGAHVGITKLPQASKPYNYTRQQMADVISNGRWTYNPCTNVKVETKYYISTMGGDSGYISPCSISPLTAGGHYATDVPRSSIIRNSDIYLESLEDTMIDVDSLSTHVAMISDAKLQNLERIFTSPRLPHSINIKFDPYDTDFSIWFAIVDVIQLKGLWRSLFSSLEEIASLRSLSLKPGRETARQLANDHLAVQFGLLPTIRDMISFTRLLSRWKAIYDSKETANKKRYWHEPQTDLKRNYPDKTLLGTYLCAITPFSNTPIQLKCRMRTILAEHKQTVSYSFLSPEFHGFFSRLAQFVDAFGVIDPAALWDAIPFSFIVDWFLGVGYWLHKNRPKVFPVDVVIRDYCESFKLVRRHDWYASWESAINAPYCTGSFTETDSFLGSETHTTYLRRRFNPENLRTMVPSVRSEVMSIRRILISAALIAQRVPR